MSTGQFIQSFLLFSASSAVGALQWVLRVIQRASLFILTFNANYVHPQAPIPDFLWLIFQYFSS